MKKIFKLDIRSTSLILYAAILGIIISTQFCYADVTVGSYCQLSIQTIQQEVSNFQELVDLAMQYPDDRDALNQQEAIKKAEFIQAKDALFNSYGITDKEYAMYMGKNGRAVKKYLGANPEIKQQINDLSEQKMALLQQYEKIKNSIGPAKLPLP